MIINETFRKFAHGVSVVVGSPWAFAVALLIIVVWAAMGPLAGFSDTWQLIINTGTTIVTFLIVFLIQNTQNRDAKAIHLKLDELIRAIKEARTNLVDLEELSDEELERLQREFRRLHEKCAAGDAASCPPDDVATAHPKAVEQDHQRYRKRRRRKARS